MGGSRFSAEVPKGDGWGLEVAIAEAVEAIMSGEKSPLMPVVGVIDIKEIKLDPETHTQIAVVRVRRLEALTNLQAIRKAQRMLLDQWALRRGDGAVLPFEEKEMIERAFGSVDTEQIEQDERELKEDEDLAELDRLRRHLVAVHNVAKDVVDGDDDLDVRRRHHELHETEPMDVAATPHSEDWWGWRRVEIEEALQEALDTTDGKDEAAADETDATADETEPYDADGMVDGGHGGSPHEAADEAADDEQIEVPDTPESLFNDGTADTGKD